MKSLMIGVGVLAASCLAACGGSGGGESLDSGGGTPPMPDETPQISVGNVFPSLSFAQPTALKQAPGDDSRWKTHFCG